MTKTNDFANLFQDLIAGKVGDMNLMNDAAKNSAEFATKFNKIALEAAEKNAELANAWMKDSLSKLAPLTEKQDEPAGYAKLAADIASAQAQSTPEHVAKFAEVAKSAQMATADLIMTAGKDLQADASKAVKAAAKSA